MNIPVAYSLMGKGMLRDDHNIAVVTNDIFTKEDAEFLVRNGALPADRILAVETGGCPHTAVRDDISPNLAALDRLMETFTPELLFVESGGDNLAAQFSRELADYTIYVIDVSGGDKIPRKGGPGITRSDLLVINKTDLAPHVGADLGVADRRDGDGGLVEGVERREADEDVSAGAEGQDAGQQHEADLGPPPWGAGPADPASTRRPTARMPSAVTVATRSLSAVATAHRSMSAVLSGSMSHSR